MELKGRSLQGEAKEYYFHLILLLLSENNSTSTMIYLVPKIIYFEIIFYIQSLLFLILMGKCFSSTELDDYFQQQDIMASKESHHFSFIVLPYESPELNAVDAYVGKYLHCILYNNKGMKYL